MSVGNFSYTLDERNQTLIELINGLISGYKGYYWWLVGKKELTKTLSIVNMNI